MAYGKKAWEKGTQLWYLKPQYCLNKKEKNHMNTNLPREKNKKTKFC